MYALQGETRNQMSLFRSTSHNSFMYLTQLVKEYQTKEYKKNVGYKLHIFDQE